MDDHHDVLPAQYNRPTPDQKEEHCLRAKYTHFKQKGTDLTEAQRALQSTKSLCVFHVLVRLLLRQGLLLQGRFWKNGNQQPWA